MIILDWRSDMPRHKTRRAPLRRGFPRFVTLHHNGPAIGQVRTIDGWKAHLQFIAQYHIDSPALIGDGIQYHYAILPAGEVAWLRDDNARLSHAGNALANTESLAIHFPLGGSQVPTSAAWDAFGALFVSFSLKYQIAPQNVYGHRQWPRKTGAPAAAKKQQPGQGPCPGDGILALLAGWKAQRTAHAYEVVRATVARISPNENAAIAWGGSCVLPVGHIIEECTPAAGGFVHWPAAGFVASTNLKLHG